ncbi:MAG: CoA transferase [Dehalococcoidales bacterium]|nr:CoA transferase [Dehalococcoidales bacterium]
MTRKKSLLQARVIDLCDEKGSFCGKVLAELGADVIKIEPPGGDACRNIGPFYGNQRHPEKSLSWNYVNLNKRSLTLDLNAARGRDTFMKLAATADFIIESFEPGYLDSIGLSYAELEKINPGVIMISITPFGQTGPYAHYKATDIVVMAAGGMIACLGDPDRPPVRISEPTAFYLGSLHALTGGLIAYYHRELTGEGQHVDASCQEAAVLALTRVSEAWDISQINQPRQGIYQVIPRNKEIGSLHTRRNFQCKDGYVNAQIMGGGQSGVVASSKALVKFANENGMNFELTNYDWRSLDTSKIAQATLDEVQSLLTPFLLTQTKRTLFEESLARGILLAPINDASDIMTNPELRKRRFFVRVKDRNSEKAVRYAGFPIKISGIPNRFQRPAPRIGEHNDEILNEIESAGKKPSTVIPGPKRQQALEGVKIADFSRAASVPLTMRELAEHGAMVVRVDSHKNPDNIRFLSPFKDGIAGINRGALAVSYNTNKYCISLDVKHPEGLEVARRLIKWADVVVENMRPGAMAKLGLDYESCRQVKPDIIYASGSQMGQVIPYGGYGLQAASIAGFAHLLGWPDRGPVAPVNAYPDFISPYYLAGTIALALDYRRKTGKGVYLDQSQVESGVALLGPALLDYEVNGKIANRRGNEDSYMAPHAAYPCRGEDQWVAIAIENDGQWRALCRVLDKPELERDEFKTFAGRKANQGEIDRLIGVWTVNLGAFEAMKILQAAGVPAGIVANGQELFEDPQLQHRQHFRKLVHNEIGEYSCHSPAYKLSRTPCRITKPGPGLGEDNWFVYREILGYSEDEVADMLAKGVITTEADIVGAVKGTY